MSGQDKKILVIDDSNTNVVLLEAVFGSDGYKMLTATNAKDAFQVVLKEKPEIILLDLNMPEISGFDFLSRIKANKKTCDIPVIIVSALTDEMTIKSTMSLGAVAFIKKPIDIPLIRSTVSELLV
jgi:response regulator RpfG family c-di-GMP phosphodiesterase